MNIYTLAILITVCIIGSCALCFVSSKWQRTPTQQANLKAKRLAKKLPALIILAVLLPSVAYAQDDPCYALYSAKTLDAYFEIANPILGEDAPADFNESLWDLATEGGPCYLKRSTNIIASFVGRGAEWQAYRTDRANGTVVQPVTVPVDACRRLYEFTDGPEFMRYVGNQFAHVSTAQGAAGTLWAMMLRRIPWRRTWALWPSLT